MRHKKKGLIVCDIDNTVSVLGENRAKMLLEPVIDWDAFYTDPFNDESIDSSCSKIRALMNNGFRVVFSTSRRETVRDKTLGWLQRNINRNIHDGMLIMRPNDCHAPEAEQKVNGVLSRYHASDIALVIDDNQSVLDAWRAVGVPVLNACMLQS